jgi:hypothetical protein
MNTSDLNGAAIHLRKGEVHRIPKGRGQRIEAISGSLWVTIDNDLRDIFVATGEGFTLGADDKTLVSALADSRFVVLQHH